MSAGPQGKIHSFVVKGNVFEVYERYQNLSPVGSGAYGLVCSADDTATGKRVAIKKVADTFHDLIDAKRILREMKLLWHFTSQGHENVIALRDVFTMPPNTQRFADVYIVTDLMESDLQKIVASKQPLTEAHVRYFLYELLRGLKFVHSASVLHRDLKPSNLLVNSNCELAICDFGLARGIKDEEEEQSEEMTEYVVTRWYRAPELLTECEQYGKAIDVWSVGCIFAELLLRKPLFRGRNYIHQLKLIIDLLGTPSDEDMEFITFQEARASIRAMSFRPKVPLASKFPSAGPMALDLLQRMLVFSPASRCTVEEALAHPYLSEYHNESLEPSSDSPFDFSFERGGAHLPKKELQAKMYEVMTKLHQAGGSVPSSQAAAGAAATDAADKAGSGGDSKSEEPAASSGAAAAGGDGAAATAKEEPARWAGGRKDGSSSGGGPADLAELSAKLDAQIAAVERLTERVSSSLSNLDRRVAQTVDQRMQALEQQLISRVERAVRDSVQAQLRSGSPDPAGKKASRRSGSAR